MPLLILGLVLTVILAGISVFTGAAGTTPLSLFTDHPDAQAMQILLVSRIPRTLAILIAGASLAVAGLVMQMIIRNRFVEPSTTGTTESAMLGFLTVTLLAPGWPVLAKMAVAALFALAGTLLFLRILRTIPLRDAVLVPLVGIMLSGLIGAVCSFFAYRFNMLPSLLAWSMGDFSGVLRGRYELLWLGLVAAMLAYVTADRFTIAGMGQDFTRNLGLNYQRIMVAGLVIVSTVAAVGLVSVGVIPFLGLVVPNVVSLIMGDNMRRSLPWVALGGAGFVLACDILGRLIRYPYEIPIGVVMGVIGSGIFLWLLLRRPPNAA